MSSKSKRPTPSAKHKPTKPAQKQPLPVPERIKRHFNSLCAQIDGGHFANAIKTCDKILRLDPNDQDALRTKLFLYLQTEQYVPALEIIGSGDEHAFEKAYAFYRLQKEDEASAVLEDIKNKNGSEDRGAMHLEAQLSYRQGSYQTAYDLYNQLLDTAEPGSEEHSDVLVNLQAAQQHLDFINSGFLQGIDALPAKLRNSIESLPPPVPTSTSSSVAAIIASSSNTAPADAGKLQEQKKKVRMKRVPKGVVPGVTPPPDPERWLKKSERSTFGQGKKRKGAGGGGGATQGASVDVPPSGGGGAAGKKGKKRK